MTVTAAELDAERDRDLRRLRLAVVNALFSGATEEQVTEAIEAGVADAEADPIMRARRATPTS
jgi:alkylhydroperoxidase/carboxymuconolactone decarboxylase family protein YurZ